MENNNQYYQEPVQPMADSQPVYQPVVEEPAKQPNKVFGIVSIITGIAGLLFSCCYGSGSVLSIVGLVMAFIDRSKNGKMSALSVVGLICGIIGILIALGWLIYAVVFVVILGANGSGMYY